jgi:hypothetical protein
MRRVAVVVATVLLAGTAFGVPAAQAAASIDADITTVDPHIDQDLRIQGTVTGTTPPATLQVTRIDSAGNTPLFTTPLMLSGDGPIDVTDQPPVRGTVTYRIEVNDPSGTATQELTVYVTGITTNASATTPKRIVRTGRTVTITGHLANASPGAAMYLFATPYKRHRELIKSGPVAPDGTLSVQYTLTRRTKFRAAFRGDETHEPSFDRVLVRARAHVTDRLGGGYATRKGYRLYGSNTEPPLYGHLRPERRDACLYYKAQRRYLGEWHTVETSGCVRTDRDGRTVRVLEGNHVLDTPYRVRVEWHGSTAWLRDNAPWLKLKFRRR